MEPPPEPPKFSLGAAYVRFFLNWMLFSGVATLAYVMNGVARRIDTAMVAFSAVLWFYIGLLTTYSLWQVIVMWRLYRETMGFYNDLKKRGR